jgi:hypothetical protein
VGAKMAEIVILTDDQTMSPAISSITLRGAHDGGLRREGSSNRRGLVDQRLAF